MENDSRDMIGVRAPACSSAGEAGATLFRGEASEGVVKSRSDVLPAQRILGGRFPKGSEAPLPG